MAIMRIRCSHDGIGHCRTVRESMQVIPRAVWTFHLDIQKAHQLAGLRFAAAHEIATDWRAAYKKWINGKGCGEQ
jgi:hypothetical protein